MRLPQFCTLAVGVQALACCSSSSGPERPYSNAKAAYRCDTAGVKMTRLDHRNGGSQENAPLAQLDRASVYGTEGYWFESSGVY